MVIKYMRNKLFNILEKSDVYTCSKTKSTDSKQTYS